MDMEKREPAATEPSARRELGDRSSYSRFSDPSIFPRFGGDDLDPPPYATDRRSDEEAACAPSLRELIALLNDGP